MVEPWASLQYVIFFTSEDHLRGTKPDLRGTAKAGNDMGTPDPELTARESPVKETVREEGVAGECSKQ